MTVACSLICHVHATCPHDSLLMSIRWGSMALSGIGIQAGLGSWACKSSQHSNNKEVLWVSNGWVPKGLDYVIKASCCNQKIIIPHYINSGCIWKIHNQEKQGDNALWECNTSECRWGNLTTVCCHFANVTYPWLNYISSKKKKIHFSICFELLVSYDQGKKSNVHFFYLHSEMTDTVQRGQYSNM